MQVLSPIPLLTHKNTLSYIHDNPNGGLVYAFEYINENQAVLSPPSLSTLPSLRPLPALSAFSHLSLFSAL